MKLFILIPLLLVSSQCFGSDDSLLHITAHFGATYVIAHVTEVLCTRVNGVKNKLACTIVAVTLANVINIERKALQGFPSDTKRATISGAAGSLAAAIVINF